MIGFRINGIPLVLFPNTSVNVQFIAAALSDDLQDDFSLPFAVPRAGNERVLGHVHDIALHQRTIKFTGASMEYMGVQRKTGVLYVEQADEERISLSFTITGFIGKLRGLRLPQMNMGAPILTGGVAAYAKAVNTQAWPANPCCFPMYYAPEFYGEENPGWSPGSVSDWTPGGTFDLNAFVRHTFGSPVLHEFIYQHITVYNAGPPAEDPVNWRRTAFGIVNHWDWENEVFFENDTASSFYAMSPCFYLKHILQQAAAHLGMKVRGSWFTDNRYDRLFLYNNQALDKGAQSAYFMAHQTGTTTFTAHVLSGTTPVAERLPAQDETTPPNQDGANVWDPVNMRWQCPSAGSYTFRVYLPFSFTNSDQLLGVLLMREGAPDSFVLTQEHSITFPYSGLSTFNFTATAADVGQWFYFRPQLVSMASFTFLPLTIANSWVEGWKNESTIINQFSDTITPSEHVPDMELSDLLLDLKSIFGLAVTVANEGAELVLDYAADKLRATPVEMTTQVRSPISIDLNRRSEGFAWKWPQNAGSDAPDLPSLVKQGEYTCYSDVPPPDGPGCWCVVLADRRILTSKYDSTNGYVWQQSGQHLPAKVVGDAAAASEVSPSLGLFDSRVVGVKLRDFLVPYVQDQCRSKLFIRNQGTASLLIGFFHGMQPNLEGTLYPYASSFGYRMDGFLVSYPELDFASDRGPVALHQQALAEARVAADPITCDLEVSPDYLDGRLYERPQLIHGQRCMVVSLPVTLADGRGVLIARKSNLLRLPNTPASQPLYVPSAMRLMSCLYYQDFSAGIHEMDNLDTYKVQSFMVDGVQFVATPIALDGALSVIDVDGRPFLTNLIDVLNDLDVPGFAFTPNKNLRPVRTEEKGGYFRMTQPVGSNWEILIMEDSPAFGEILVYRYSSTHGAQQRVNDPTEPDPVWGYYSYDLLPSWSAGPAEYCELL